MNGTGDGKAAGGDEGGEVRDVACLVQHVWCHQAQPLAGVWHVTNITGKRTSGDSVGNPLIQRSGTQPDHSGRAVTDYGDGICVFF